MTAFAFVATIAAILLGRRAYLATKQRDDEILRALHAEKTVTELRAELDRHNPAVYEQLAAVHPLPRRSS